MAAAVTVLNAERLLRKLRIIPEAMKNGIREVMVEQAEDIVDTMRRLVPRGRTGRLAMSIGWRWGYSAPDGTEVVATVKVASQRRAPADLTITIYAGNAEAYYARWVEFGTRKMRKQPFFFVSWRAGRKQAKNKMRAKIRKVARQVAAVG